MEDKAQYHSKVTDEILDQIHEYEMMSTGYNMRISALIDDWLKKLGLSKEMLNLNEDVVNSWLSGTHDFKISEIVKIESELKIKIIEIV